MLSARSKSEYNNLLPNDWMKETENYFCGRFQGAEIRVEAWEKLVKTISPHVIEEEKQEPLLRVADFYESVGEPPAMIAAGVLAPNTVLLVSAKPKSGKTFLMLQMADDISSGTPLFGKWEVEKPGPVVYLAMEGSKFQFRERIEKRGMHFRNPEVYIYHARKNLSTFEGVQWLVTLIEPIQPSLVIIDTARQAFKVDDWNNASMVQTRLSPLIEAVQGNSALKFPSGCACVIVHHNNKNAMAEGGDKISGTNAFQGIVDGTMVLDRKKRLANGDLQVEAECEGRIDMPDKITFLMDTETLQCRVLEDEEAQALRVQTANESMKTHFPHIEQILEENGEPMTAAEIEAKTGITKSYLSRIISAMAKAEIIEPAGQRVPPGGGKPARVYRLVRCSLYIKENTELREQNNPSEIEAKERVQNFMDAPDAVQTDTDNDGEEYVEF